jgi:Na+-translocating ferredoxin:NAD+ oxidoreductase subunit B
MPSLADPEFVRQIDALLPQTQCKRCGYDACRPYAEALATGDAINRCPPGGDAVITALSILTGRSRVPLDRAHGEHTPFTVARVDEASCIGCTLCIDACPVDAIIGAAKRMHTVLPALCTGCELCLPPCPVDCIDMVPAGRAWSPADARAASERFEARNLRETRKREGARKVPAAIPSPFGPSVGPSKAETVEAALARARARRAAAGNRVR